MYAWKLYRWLSVRECIAVSTMSAEAQDSGTQTEPRLYGLDDAGVFDFSRGSSVV